MYSERWTKRMGGIECPPRLPDLSPLCCNTLQRFVIASLSHVTK